MRRNLARLPFYYGPPFHFQAALKRDLALASRTMPGAIKAATVQGTASQSIIGESDSLG